MKIIENPHLANEYKYPWLISSFLYPASASGMVHIAIFVFLPRIVSFIAGILGSLLAPYLRKGTGYILFFLFAPFYIVFYSYILYYITDCLISSSKGGKHAAEVAIADNISAGDLISQAVLLIGCVAICLCPAAIYYALRQQADLTFWALSAGGGFFLPMSLLRGIIFSSSDALNPISIIRSIFSTFFSYCGLFLFFCALVGIYEFIQPCLHLWDFLSDVLKFYLLFVLTHRLGWFYWWHKDKLDWGI